MEKFRGVERMVVREKLPGLGTDAEARRLKSHEFWRTDTVSVYV